MAYMSQTKKAELVAAAKPILKKFGLKGSFSAPNGSGIRLKIKSGPIDFIKNYNETLENRGAPSYGIEVVDHLSVNPYWYKKHFSGLAAKALDDLIKALNKGNHDNSDIQTDYFDIGWYVYVDIGAWDKPYILEK